MMKSIYVALIIILSISTGQSQIFGKIMERATSKVQDKIEDRLAEEIANAIYKPINDAIEEQVREQYKRDSIAGETNVSFADYIESLTKDVDLPESYDFDLAVKTEYKYKKDVNVGTTYFSSGKNVFGFKSEEDDNMVVIDGEHQIMAMYDTKENTVTAIPSMINAFTKSVAKESMKEHELISFEKTGKSKKIKGYPCDQYVFESQSDKGKVWITEQLNYNWDELYAKTFQDMLPKANKNLYQKGMVLSASSKDKESGDKYVMKVIDINQDGMMIDNSKYQKESLTTDR